MVTMVLFSEIFLMKIFMMKIFVELVLYVFLQIQIPFLCDYSSRKLLDVQSYMVYGFSITDKNRALLSLLFSVF